MIRSVGKKYSSYANDFEEEPLNRKIFDTATIYHDGDNADWHDNPYDYAIDTREVDSTTALDLRLAPGGGAAVKLLPSD